MACPYFHPTRPFREQGRLPVRPPLGGLFEGECKVGARPLRPEADQLRELCNYGYARHGCTHFPSDAVADAVRFLVVSDVGESIQLAYSIERNHYPAGAGTLAFTPRSRALEGEAPGETLRAQALAYLDRYLEVRDSNS